MALLWASGKTGTLSPWSTALAVGMLKDKKKRKWSYADIGKRLTKIGIHPSKQSSHCIRFSKKIRIGTRAK